MRAPQPLAACGMLLQHIRDCSRNAGSELLHVEGYASLLPTRAWHTPDAAAAAEGSRGNQGHCSRHISMFVPIRLHSVRKSPMQGCLLPRHPDPCLWRLWYGPYTPLLALRCATEALTWFGCYACILASVDRGTLFHGSLCDDVPSAQGFAMTQVKVNRASHAATDISFVDRQYCDAVKAL